MGQKLPSPNDPRNLSHPGPSNYEVKPQQVLPERYKKVGFGYGVKCTAQKIRQSPGPGYYNLGSFTDKYNSKRCKPLAS